MRKFLGTLCYIITLAIYGVLGYLAYITYHQEISYQLGLLLCLPIYIVSYWFSTFFSQLFDGKDNNQKPLINRKVRKALTSILSIINLVVLFSWIGMYVYIFLYSTYLNSK